jgi:hypothetical protein
VSHIPDTNPVHGGKQTTMTIHDLAFLSYLVNKYLSSFETKRDFANNTIRAKVTSKQYTDQQQQIEEELQEFNRRWQHKNGIISRIIQLEKVLGRLPTMSDLLFGNRFDRNEPDLVSDSLPWLMHGSIQVQNHFPSIGDGSNDDLAMIVSFEQRQQPQLLQTPRLHSQPSSKEGTSAT